MRAAVLVLALLAQGAGQSTVRTAVIAGRILNFDGAPADGVRVAIMAPPAQGVPAALLKSAETDRSGRYRLEEIPPGRYYLAAGPLDAATYFPGVTAIEKAVAVTVVSGAAQEDRDFTLAVPLLRLSGRVIRDGDPTGRQSERRDQVGLFGPGMTKGMVQTLGPIGADDTFEFRNLPPGLYQLRVVGDALRMQSVTVSLSAQDITGYALTVPRSAVRAAVSVSATVAGGGPIPNFPLRLTPPGQPPFMRGGPGAGGAALAGADPQQSFTLGPIPFAPESTDSKAGPQAVPVGEYKVVIGFGGPGLPEGFSVESVSAGTVNLLSENLILAAGDKVQISVVLNVSSPPPGRKVAGRVVGAAGSGDARIGITGPISFAASIGPNGAFEFPHVIPGHYVVQIFPNGNSMEGASIVGNLVVARDELTNLQIPAAFPTFKVSGRGTGEAELRRKGRLGIGAVVAILSGPARPGPLEPPGFRPGGEDPESQPLAPDGSFQFSGVRPGKYLLWFSAGMGYGSIDGPLPKAKKLTVVDKDVTGLVVKIEPGKW